MGGQKKAPARFQTQPGQAGSVLLARYTCACNENSTERVAWLLYHSGGQPTEWQCRFLRAMETILLAGWSLSGRQRRHIDRMLAMFGGKFFLKRDWLLQKGGWR
jgi:hypothetical protein